MLEQTQHKERTKGRILKEKKWFDVLSKVSSVEVPLTGVLAVPPTD